MKRLTVTVPALRTMSVLALLASLLSVPQVAPAPAVLAAGPADSLAPRSAASVQTQNGGVLHSVTAYLVYWKQVDQSFLGQTFYYEAPRCYGPGCLGSYGTDKNYEDRTGTFFQDVGGSAWYGVLSQYWDTTADAQPVPVFNELTLGGTWEDNRDYPNLGRGVPAARLQPADLQAEIANAIQHNGWTVTPDSLFYIYLPEEVQACTAAGLCTDTTINGDACGFHDTTNYGDQQITYAVIPSPGDTEGCDATITSPSTDLVVDNAINAEAHELAEAVTDPHNGSGWSDLAADQTADGGEVGDKCEHDFPGRGAVLADGGNITLNGHDYIVQSLWSDLDGGCTLGRVAPPYLDVQGIQSLQVEDGSPSIAITGHNFSPTSSVLWNGTPIPTTYHSSQALSASIPAGNLARPGVATITVSQQSTTGGTSNPRLVYITQNTAAISASQLIPDFSGTTTIGTAPNLLAVTANGGTGTLAVAQFSGNPAGGQTTGTTNTFFDVSASPSGFSGLSIQDCALNGGSQVDWYDPAAGWRAASKQTYDPATRCVTVTVDGTSSPSLSQLQGTTLASWSRSRGYVVLRGDDALAPIVEYGSVGQPIHVGHQPDAIVLSPDGATAYVANAGDNSVAQVALASGTLTTTYQVGQSPTALAITPNGQTVYAANALDNTVSAIDTGQGRVTSIPVGTKPAALAISPDGTTLYVANRASNSLSVITTATNEARSTTIPAGPEPDFIALASNGSLAYVADAAANQVLPIALPSGAAGTPIAVGKSPLGIALTPDGRRAFVANYDDASATPIDLSGSTPLAGTPISVGTDPAWISISPDGSVADVANAGDGTVTPITVATGATSPAFSVGNGAASAPDGIAVVSVVQPPLSAPAPAPAKPAPRPSSGGTAPATSSTTINDTDPAISYRGSGWGYYGGRPTSVGDLGNDVHATTHDGDTVSYTFTGTGIAYVSERSDGYGTVQVSLDGVVQTVVDANAPGVHNQGGQTLFSVSGLPLGQHTIELEKTGGVYLLLDDFVVQTMASGPGANNVRLVNDSDPAIVYTGSAWGTYGGRPASVFDVRNDVHATTNNGDAVSYTFSGTGVAYISELSDGYGLVDVYLDGALQTTIDANAPGVHNHGGQILYHTTGLAPGQHTIKLVKKSGAYLLLDAFAIQP